MIVPVREYTVNSTNFNSLMVDVPKKTKGCEFIYSSQVRTANGISLAFELEQSKEIRTKHFMDEDQVPFSVRVHEFPRSMLDGTNSKR